LLVVCIRHAGFLLLIYFSTPAALRKFFAAPLLYNFLPQCRALRGKFLISRTELFRLLNAE
jgi:hypothetical protein